MIQAISTKYLGPTNNRGSRIKATCAAKSIVVSYKSELSLPQNYENAARSLMQSLGWDKTSDIVSGYTKDGCVHVQVPKKGE